MQDLTPSFVSKRGWNTALGLAQQGMNSNPALRVISALNGTTNAINSAFVNIPDSQAKGAHEFDKANLFVGGVSFGAGLSSLTRAGANSVGRNAFIDFNTIDNVVPGSYWANPSQLRFTQSDASPFFSKGGRIDSLVDDIRAGKISPEQVGDPLQVVMREGKPFSIDNRRLVAFNQAGVSEIPIQVMSLKDPIVADRFFNRFDPIGGEGLKIVITPSSGRTAAQQLLRDYELIKGVQLEH